ncbi:MAG: superoxide dismutase [Pelagibacteraceae bacterium]|nr:superoxide dismutase [Pelagibacteraceae bacterium]|tara:strand:- start:327 stop:923 length:597 start_codon:yes stop_codon:yes gene_type:complete
MTLELPDLPYSHDALESNGMCKETMEFHHDLHHKAYVDNGNKLLAGSEFEGKEIEAIITGSFNKESKAQNGIFNNVAQHWNHCEFWKMMSPGGSKIPSELESKINDSFDSYEKFKEEFVAAGVSQFGSGWCWLVMDNDKLMVTKTENGVNPLCFSQKALLGCDVWEHSYYLDYRNKRPAYIENFLDNLVNWEYVASKL